jgi:UDP-N-acetylmuramate dehydrogenase
MPLPTPAVAALREAGIPCAEDVPLARKTWWRAGGPADGYVEVDDLDTLRAVQSWAARFDLPVFPLGNASNLLISDAGIRGLVIRLTGSLAQVVAEGSPPLLTIGGGAKLMSLISRAQREGWTGLEPLAGVPGTLGGAVCMNAGTRLGEIRDVLVDVQLVLRGGADLTLPRDALHMRYRHSDLPAGAVLAHARLQTTGTDPDASRAAIAEHLAYRARTQPVDVPTCGSTFRNPPGDSAGRLIETAGLKGARIGGAVVSEKHANFLINTGDATANDLAALIRHVQQRVADAHGVWLEPEVHFAGDWSEPPALGKPSARDI